MIRVYLYKKVGDFQPDYAWQHDMGLRLLAGVKEQPENAGLLFHNISHSRGLVAVAVADAPVGVDVECERKVSGRLAPRILSEREQRYLSKTGGAMGLLQLWTLKESYGKALGVGIAYPLSGVEFIPMPPEMPRGWQRVECSESGMSCFSMLQDDFVISVCLCRAHGEEPVFVSCYKTNRCVT